MRDLNSPFYQLDLTDVYITLYPTKIESMILKLYKKSPR